MRPRWLLLTSHYQTRCLLSFSGGVVKAKITWWGNTIVRTSVMTDPAAGEPASDVGSIGHRPEYPVRPGQMTA